MNENNIKILKQMKAELEDRIAALDSAISLLERVDSQFERGSETVICEPVEPKKKAPKRTKKQPVVSQEIDMSTIPDFNPNGGGIRLDI